MNTYTYSPFGELIVEQEEVKLNIGFNTKYEDASGLIYYNNRYYDSDLGRFISQDPIFEEGGVNLYNFVENDPINHWDILGYKEGTRGIRIFNDGGSVVEGPSRDASGVDLADRIGSAANLLGAIDFVRSLINRDIASIVSYITSLTGIPQGTNVEQLATTLYDSYRSRSGWHYIFTISYEIVTTCECEGELISESTTGLQTKTFISERFFVEAINAQNSLKAAIKNESDKIINNNNIGNFVCSL